jgi:hypothetical protein
MKKIINSSRPVVVTTTRTPLNGSLTIDAGGASLSQVYDAIYGTWAPVDRRLTPLVLTPIVSIADPDTGQQVPLSKLSSVEYKWYVGNSTTPVTSRTPSDDYHQQTDDDTAQYLERGKYPRFRVIIDEECTAHELANALHKAAEYLHKRAGKGGIG